MGPTLLEMLAIASLSKVKKKAERKDITSQLVSHDFGFGGGSNSLN
jgi:hypothetical protein